MLFMFAYGVKLLQGLWIPPERTLSGYILAQFIMTISLSFNAVRESCAHFTFVS